MNAKLRLRRKYQIAENNFFELIIWSLSSPLPGSGHNLKYRLVLVVDDFCAIRYDNEAGKGDHKHIGNKEIPYQFKSQKKLIRDFWNDVDNWEA